MKTERFIQRLLEQAKEQGITAAEVYVVNGQNFECQATQGEITKYSVNTSCGLSLRGIFHGRMGCAATEALDEDALAQLIEGVKESADLLEDTDEQDIYRGASVYPQVDAFAQDLETISSSRKMDAALALEQAVLGADARIKSVPYCAVETESGEVRIVNSFGMDLRHRSNVAVMFAQAVAQEGETKSSQGKVVWGRNFDALSPKALGREVAELAVSQLHGQPVKSGVYRVILSNEAMASLLATFSSIFSAEEAQQGLSLLKGREGQMVASAAVTLADDPLLPDGLASRPFDAEGMPAYTKNIVEKGVLTTLLHNRKTARKQGVESTANASKAGYAAPVRVAPTNFFFKPGEKSLAEMMAQMGKGLLITDLSGLHSGADPISGDFSLLSKGYRVENGQKGVPVEQITIAGNFYELLKDIREVGTDLVFPGQSIGSPSVDIGEISVAGL